MSVKVGSGDAWIVATVEIEYVYVCKVKLVVDLEDGQPVEATEL